MKLFITKVEAPPATWGSRSPLYNVKSRQDNFVEGAD